MPGQPNLFFMGAAGGGVWKTIDAGQHWTPILDDAGTGSIGAVAVAPSNPDVIYVGTGEGALRGDITNGMGVFKSTDGGKTWTHVGLRDTRQIGTIIVDPTNPDVVLVAAIGHAFGPNTERGVFRTTDGGKTWTRTLYKDPDTGAIDVTFDPHNPQTVWAAMWTVRRQPWNFSSGGAGSGLYRSDDGGATWTQVTGHGLPTGILGRIDVSVSGANPQPGLRQCRGGGRRPLPLRRRRRAPGPGSARTAASASAPGTSPRSTPTPRASTPSTR